MNRFLNEQRVNMKQVILILTFLLLSTTVVAGGRPDSAPSVNSFAGASSKASSTAGSVAAVISSPTSGSQTSIYSKTDYGKIVASAIAPALTASVSEFGCLGSATGALQTSVVGISGGSTVLDESCVFARNLVLLDFLGEREAAVQMACTDPDMGAALRLVNRCKTAITPEPVTKTSGYVFENY